ncbi:MULTISPECIES: CAP domain-containing protein [Legionella]|uniref:CAP domain-containing protein n=1 Tax=Legionella resiliens TaxID=2905958 RepID=A0ABS8X818_9GAMM|nr:MULTISPECIES: CAP domain-containing protein [unclassified Legionella]MCE0724483.1 CAP domain-containing protein [Legionella sp. 9fVS26]MCE3533636.1 CAP domain-containing protein [Legionella sp. 8cVS16]QLZ69826.1 CAP domain-containing protein [Legionella sp. PC1000]
MSLKTKIMSITSIVFALLPCAYAAAPAKHIDSDTAMQSTVLFYINEYRQKHGLSKLTMDKHMVIQARQHSQDMANHRMPFGHQDFGKRIAKLRSQIKNTGGAAENVAYNYKTAQIVVSQWVKSPGHRRNIVGNYNLTGIGIARDKQGKLYYTQIFLQTSKSPRSYTVRRPYIGVPFFGIKRHG